MNYLSVSRRRKRRRVVSKFLGGLKTLASLRSWSMDIAYASPLGLKAHLRSGSQGESVSPISKRVH